MTIKLERAALALACLMALCGCKTREIGPSAQATEREVIFSDDFARQALGPRWTRGEGEGGSGAWRLEQGWLVGDQIKNDPLWLDVNLPERVRVEFKAKALTAEGDLKVEIFGDGRVHASGYVVIFGGWKNSLDVIARLDEHGADRKAQPTRGVVKDQVYQLALERDGGTLSWFVDDELVMRYEDAAPLRGPQHARFAFNDWAAKVAFDDVTIYALR